MSMRALDLCTGSGCVAITLARERPTSRVVAADSSTAALAVARDNASRLGAYNVAFCESDLYGTLEPLAPFDVITANPPYIPSAEIDALQTDIRDFEPRLALDGGADGLSFTRRIVEEARRFLAPDGVLALEIGEGQSERVRALFSAAGLAEVEVARDYARTERVVSAVLR